MTTPRLSIDICRSYIEELIFGEADNSKPKGIGAIGVELEVFPYMPDLKSIKGMKSVALTGEESTLVNALVPVSEYYKGVAKYWKPGSHLIGYNTQIERIDFPEGDSFLFEPGGQVEISTVPCDSIHSLQSHLSSKQQILNEVTKRSNIQFTQSGTNPWFDVHEIKNQLHKPRYKSLENYFDRIGPFGKQMMLQTGSLHINLDYGSDQTTCIKRIVAANLLVPFATAIFANSSIIEGKVNGYKSYRSFLWQNLDPARTGILRLNQLSRTMEKEHLLDAYLEFALKAPVIYIPGLEDSVVPQHFTLEHWMSHSFYGLWPNTSHLTNHLSLLFPEVRLKNYLEIRSVDAPPFGWEIVPVMFYTGLLYTDKHLDEVLEMLLPLTSRLDHLFVAATHGLANDEIFEIAKKLMKLAIDGFSGLPDDFKSEQNTEQLIQFYERFTLTRTTFADEDLEKIEIGKASDSP